MNTIGKYKICGLLGRGGMGKVFKVEVPVIRRILALKLLAPAEPLRRLLGRPELERLFIEEAVTMAGIRHPHVIAVFDFGTFREHPYFVMDYYGNNNAKYVVVDPEAYTLELRYIPYDVEATVAKILNAGLPESHATRLR